MYFNSVFDYSRRKHHLLFSAFTSILLINVLMMALPFFEVLYYVRISTIIIIIALEYSFVSAWILLTHRLWRKMNPPVPSVLFCTNKRRGTEIARKINSMKSTNRIDRVVLYDEVNFPAVVKRYKAIFLDSPLRISKTVYPSTAGKEKRAHNIARRIRLVINNATLVQFDDIMVYRAKPIGLTPEQRFLKGGRYNRLRACADPCESGNARYSHSDQTDGGPVFYSQKRVTRGGREFDLHKFRTMVPDAEKLTGPVLAMKDDPRITKIGKKLRQTRLDEIPQLWNTLKGDMSLVGPRPEREHFIELYKESILSMNTAQWFAPV
jgi:hypothetical protein